MKLIFDWAVKLVRLLMAVLFLPSAIRIIDQSVPAKEAIEHGIPAALVPSMMLAGHAAELVGGLALPFGFYPLLAALALQAFLIPVSFFSHSFWLSAGTPAYLEQLINFSTNVPICGGLLFIGATPNERTN